MKIRNGFVSNSSSSSYIVNIRVDPEDFYNLLWSGYGRDIFSKTKLIEVLQKELKDYIEYSSSNVFSGDGENIQNAIKTAEKIDPENRKEIILAILKHNYISVKEEDDEIELEHGTAMHNDFNTGVCDVLKEIILFFLMDTQHRVKARRDGDN